MNAGLNPLASHLFILYWGMLSYITPPVSLAAITAAGVAGSNATRTGVYALRLGGILFVLPFLFVLNPSLILQGELTDILLSMVTAITAIWLIASSMEGYLYRVGIIAFPLRALALVAGGLMIYPDLVSDLIGLGVIAVMYGGKRLLNPSSLPVANT